MLGGVGDIVERGLRNEKDTLHGTSYNRFVYIVNREHELLFGGIEKVKGDNLPFKNPSVAIPSDKLSDWDLKC